MKTSISKKQQLALACALALGIMSGSAVAQSNTPTDKELWVNTGTQVWKNGFGECWQSAFGPAPSAGDCVAAPVAQYVAPQAAPIVVAAAAPAPVYEKVIIDANVLFDFDKSSLRPAGRDALDAFVGKANGLGQNTVMAVGYADRFGTDGYNQKLSERRVATVKEYLVAKGVQANWVNSSAKGESQPTTRPGECSGNTAGMKVVACLQPDRHVHLEMTGQRLVK
jgi:OOP family OmpA-OmpF porin